MDSFNLLLVVLLLYVFFEVNYFLRIFFYTVCGMFLRTRNRSIDDEGVVYGMCSTTDLDFLLHMSNSRYLRELDFGRIDFYHKNGIYDALRQCGGSMVHAASSVRYRKSVTLFQVFRVRTKLLHWDGRNAYTEQRLETVHDNVVRAIVIGQQTTIGCDMNTVLKRLLGREPKSPEHLPDDLRKWIESNECSSRRLRADRALPIASTSNHAHEDQRSAAHSYSTSADLKLN